jgi:hypothetical protein
MELAAAPVAARLDHLIAAVGAMARVATTMATAEAVAGLVAGQGPAVRLQG